jgi:hypothetical protein
VSVDLEVGDLGDCPCSEGAGGGDLSGVGEAPMRFVPHRPPRRRKPRSKGKGAHCVTSHKGTVVHCYESEATANRVAQAFTRRGKAGTKFTVKKR